MMTILNNDQLSMMEELADRERENSDDSSLELVTNLADHIRKCWSLAEQAKKDIHEDLLENLRQKKGEYSSTQLSEIQKQGGSDLFRRITATKCMGAIGWINDVLNPLGEKPWLLEPTPISELPNQVQENVINQTTEVFQNMQFFGQEFTEDDVISYAKDIRDDILKQIQKEAKVRSERMEKVIEDQLAEGGFYEAFSNFIDDVIGFRNGILKGPIFRNKQVLKTVESRNEFGQVDFRIEKSSKIVPEFERISPFDFYPAPDSSNVNDAFLLEKQRFSRGELYNLIGVPGYKEDAIRRVLKIAKDGAIKEDSIGEDEFEQAEIEDKSLEVLDSQESGIVEGLEFWGSVPGSYLKEWGMEDIEDLEKEYEIWAVIIGNEVIKAELNPDMLGDRPYYVTSFEKMAGSIWGFGVPDKMKDMQRMANAVFRALGNNLAIGSGPQTMVNSDKIPAGENITSIVPFKIWQYKDHGNNAAPPIAFFSPDIKANELLSVYRVIKEEIDEDTGIPRYIYGNENVGGAGATATGLGMLMNASAKGIKRVIRNIDKDALCRLIKKLYYYNMIHNPDPSIKGDMEIRARGALALLIKEQTQQARREFLAQTNNNTDMAIIGIEGRANVMREIVKSLDLPMEKIVPTEEELQRKQQEEQYSLMDQQEQQAMMQGQMQ
jgi:hypothetical protein